MYRFSLLILLFSFNQLSFCQEAPIIEKQYIKAIQKLAKNKKIQKAFEHIQAMDPITMERHIELTEIEAPPFKEEKRGLVYADYFRTVGLDSVWIEIGRASCRERV